MKGSNVRDLSTKYAGLWSSYMWMEQRIAGKTNRCYFWIAEGTEEMQNKATCLHTYWMINSLVKNLSFQRSSVFIRIYNECRFVHMYLQEENWRHKKHLESYHSKQMSLDSQTQDQNCSYINEEDARHSEMSIMTNATCPMSFPCLGQAQQPIYPPPDCIKNSPTPLFGPVQSNIWRRLGQKQILPWTFP